MKKYIWIFFLIGSAGLANERDYLSPEAGFVGIVSWKAILYDSPQGKKRIELSALQSVDVIDQTNTSPKEVWYQIKVRITKENEESTETGWIRAKDLFSEKDLRPVKKISEWFLFVKYPDNEFLVCHILPDGSIQGYQKNQTYNEQLKVYKNVFFVGQTMLYYDGTNALIPWATHFDLITNKALFPRKEDLTSSLGKHYKLTGNRVNLRSFPSTNAPILNQLSKGSEILLLWRVGTKQRISGKSGYWARVIVPDKKYLDGYLFDAYLKEK
ncbi:MAG: SH3 domain-containing protein [Brevinematales bacterium]